MHQRIMALARFHPDVTAMTAIAARRPATRNVLLPPERHAAVAAIACLHSNFGFIDKHDAPRDLGEESVVFAASNVQSGLHPRAALSDDDRAAGHQLSAESLEAKPLRV